MPPAPVLGDNVEVSWSREGTPGQAGASAEHFKLVVAGGSVLPRVGRAGGRCSLPAAGTGTPGDPWVWVLSCGGAEDEGRSTSRYRQGCWSREVFS